MAYLSRERPARPGPSACQKKDQAGCILSWQSFAEPADPASIQTVFDESTGLTGKPRKGTHMLCVNPLTGAPETKAVASQNLGTLKPNEDMSAAELKIGRASGRERVGQYG